jgi:hypothetical protein
MTMTTDEPLRKSQAGGPSAVRPVARFIPAPLVRPRLLPAEALERLAGLLPEGTRTTLRAEGGLAVLSTPAASVWCDGRVFRWATGDGETTWPAADAEGVARQLAGP